MSAVVEAGHRIARRQFAELLGPLRYALFEVGIKLDDSVMGSFVLIRHAVECQSQVADLIAAPNGTANIQLTQREAMHRRTESLER